VKKRQRLILAVKLIVTIFAKGIGSRLESGSVVSFQLNQYAILAMKRLTVILAERLQIMQTVAVATMVAETIVLLSTVRSRFDGSSNVSVLQGDATMVARILAEKQVIVERPMIVHRVKALAMDIVR
jgi:hypothetical protein